MKVFMRKIDESVYEKNLLLIYMKPFMIKIYYEKKMYIVHHG